MTKADSIKPPSKMETITLKVFIHCEGCKRKVSKIISGLDGVLSVTIDSDSGKVTVTGAVDAKSVLQKLEKAGKHAELWSGGGGGAKGLQNHGKPNNTSNNNSKSNKSYGSKENKKSKGGISEEDQEEEGGGEDEEGIDVEAITLEQVVGKGNNSTNNSGKKGGKKGNGAGNGSIEMSDFNNFTLASNNNNNNKNLSMANYRYVSTPQDPSQENHSLQSAEYATELFSDENANNCHIM